jgi:hypothetical protein
VRAPKLITLATLVACSGTTSRQHASFAKLSFDMPEDWASRDSIRRGTATSVWTPADNDRHESITLIRSQLANVVAQAGSPTLEGLVASADGGLPGATPARVVPLFTTSGLAGVRTEVDYVPPGQRARYHRVHVVLVDREKASLVNLIYTAKTPDENLEALNLVLATIREGEG